MIRQRKDGDCGTAALAMYLEQAYEDVYLVLAQIDRRNRGGKGITYRQLQDVALRLGRPLRYRRRFALDEDEGVLGVMWKTRRKSAGHWVALLAGKIFDPGMEIPQTASDWLEQNKARATCLLSDD